MRNEDQNIAEIENEPVSQLLAGLTRVEAPKDFDFRVKARIASGRPTESLASWLPAWVRIAVPAGVLVAGSYFGFNAFYPAQPDQQTTASLGGMNPAPIVAEKPADVPTNSAPVQEERAEIIRPDTSAKTDTVPPVRSLPKPPSSNNEPSGGSVDRAVRIANTIVPNTAAPRRAITSANDRLSQMGISAVNSGSAVTVGSVKPGSVAERSGVKTGDVIEAVGAKGLRIRRDGKPMQIELKP